MDATSMVFISAMALIGGVGAFLFFLPPPSSGLAGKEMSKVYKQTKGETIEEITIVNKIIADISLRVAKPSKDLETQLKKSGYRYKSVTEYMYRRVINAAAFAVCGVAVGFYLFQLDAGFLTLLAIGAAIYGFQGPDITLRNTINNRIEKLRMEMGYVLEQFIILLEAIGIPQSTEALANCDGIGEFGHILGRIAEELPLQGSASKAIQVATDDVPSFPELEQFLDLLRSLMVEKKDVTLPMRNLAFTLRDKFKTDIKKKTGRARMQALVIMVVFGASATLLVVMIPLARTLFGGT